MKFYLTTHERSWLRRTDVPLFVSDNRMRRPGKLPVATGRWALDSGSFTVHTNGGAFDSVPVYAARVRRYMSEVGNLDWCAPQDWMCEPPILAKTGLSVAEHQARTIGSYLDLMAEGVPVVPVLQGWTLADYHACVDRYETAGVDLTRCATVGLGSVCKRQNTSLIEAIASSLASRGLSLHGFGVKIKGFGRYAHALISADSLAWSFNARKRGPDSECPHGRNPEKPGTCANCFRFAVAWRAAVLAGVPAQQLSLGVAA